MFAANFYAWQSAQRFIKATLYATLGGQQEEKFAVNAAGIDVSVCYQFPLAVKSRTAFSRLSRSVFACYLHSRLFPTLSACLFTFLFLFIIICSVTSFARSFIHSFRWYGYAIQQLKIVDYEWETVCYAVQKCRVIYDNDLVFISFSVTQVFHICGTIYSKSRQGRKWKRKTFS